MKIAAALTSMDAARTYTEVNSFTLGLQTQRQAAPLNPDPFNTRFRSLIGNSSPSPAGPVHNRHPDQIPATEPEQQQCTASCDNLLKTLTGELVGSPIQLIATDLGESNPQKNNPPLPLHAAITGRLLHYEKEEVYFSSNGTVTTEDGREFSFSLDLSMQRTMVETMEFSVKGNPLTRYLLDPLVLSFTGGPPTFSTTSFLFDLDCDGRQDNIAGLQPGCGFLAFDKNDDGCINNGLELFGPQSGNGFTDLSVFDEDGNQWIDENDPIFNALSIWRPDDQGTDTLLSLKEAGVGAISLSHIGSRFTLQGADNEIIAQVAANGIFLTEEGEVRSLQEIDLAIGDTDHLTENSDHSDEIGLLDAMTSLRIIIAMQRMRARLLVARNRLEAVAIPWLGEREPMGPFSPPGQQPSINKKTEHDKKNTTEFIQNRVKKAPKGSADEPTRPSRPNRRAQEVIQNDSVIRAMFTLDELGGFFTSNRPNLNKNLHSRMK